MEVLSCLPFELRSSVLPLCCWKRKRSIPAFTSFAPLRHFFAAQDTIHPAWSLSFPPYVTFSLHVHKSPLLFRLKKKEYTAKTVFLTFYQAALSQYSSTFRSAQYAWRLILKKNFVSWRILITSLVAITMSLLIVQAVLSTVGIKR